MLAVFLPIAALGLVIASQSKTTYTTSTRLLATLDDFYVYRPLSGGGPASVPLDQDQVIQAELELLRSPVVAERVLSRFRLDQVFPEIAEARDRKLAGASEEERGRQSRLAFQTGVDRLLKILETGAAPKTPVIFARFKHEDPEMAAEILNATIGAYLNYRAELLDDSSSDSFAAQRQSFEADLLDAEAQLRDFLVANGLSDFSGERAGIQGLLDTVKGELLAVEGRATAAQARLQELRVQLRQTDEEVDIYVEDTGDQTLQALQLERQDLLSRYTQDSRPVQAIDRRIARAEEFLNRQDGPRGTVRRGPNPVWQDLSTQLAALEAEARSLQEQRRELQRQVATLEVRQKKLGDLAPQWQELLRQRDLAERGVVDYATRESDARARVQMAQRNADNIRVIEPARAPMKGASASLPILALSLLFAGFTALMAGLLFAFTRAGFATAGSLERTLGVPVLASIPMR